MLRLTLSVRMLNASCVRTCACVSVSVALNLFQIRKKNSDTAFQIVRKKQTCRGREILFKSYVIDWMQPMSVSLNCSWVLFFFLIWVQSEFDDGLFKCFNNWNYLSEINLIEHFIFSSNKVINIRVQTITHQIESGMSNFLA